MGRKGPGDQVDVGLIATVGIFLIVLFLLPTLVGGTAARRRLCSGNGYLNATDKMCSCVSGYHGANCEYQYCPFGKS